MGGHVSLGVGFKVSEAQANPRVSFFQVSVEPDVELSAASTVSCLLCATMLPAFINNGLKPLK